MQENFRALHVRFDEDFNKMEFFSCEASLVPEEVLAGLQCGPLSCKPRFVMYLEGEKKCEIDGADYTKFEQAIGRNIPSFDD